MRILREQQGLSQYKFATMVGMNRGYLIDVEKGRRNVSFDNLMRISLGLGVRLTDLCEGVDVEYHEGYESAG